MIAALGPSLGTKTLLGDKLGFGPTACVACMWGEEGHWRDTHPMRLRFTKEVHIRIQHNTRFRSYNSCGLDED